jgi:DNA-binding GntR family transcriptional regulator
LSPPSTSPRGSVSTAKRMQARHDSDDNLSFEPSTPAGSADQIASEILRGLYDGRYVAGQKLTEAALTKRFSVGRGTVREALRRLTAEGVVTWSLHRGASIRILTRPEAREALEAIEALTGMCARLAAERLSEPEDRKNLQQTLQSLKKQATSGDAYEFARTRNRFYRLLSHIARNRELNRLLAATQTHLLRVQLRAAYDLQAERSRLADYEKIVAAVLANDGKKAERAMVRHIRAIAEVIDQLDDRHFTF